VLALMKRLGAVVLKVRSFHLPVVAALLFPMLTQLNVVQLYQIPRPGLGCFGEAFVIDLHRQCCYSVAQDIDW